MDVTPRPPQAVSARRLAAWTTLVALLSAAGFAGNLTSDPPEDAVYRWSTAAGVVVQTAVILTIVLAIAGRPGTRDMLGLHRPRSWWRALGLVLVFIVAIYALAALQRPLLQPGEEQGLVPEGWDGDRAAQFAVNALLIAGLVPIVEELTFRGLGFALLQRFGLLAAVLVVGLTFALVHGLLEGLLIFTAFGAGLAYVRHRTGSVYPCIVAHAFFNALALAGSVVAPEHLDEASGLAAWAVQAAAGVAS